MNFEEILGQEVSELLFGAGLRHIHGPSVSNDRFKVGHRCFSIQELVAYITPIDILTILAPYEVLCHVPQHPGGLH